MYLAMNRKSNDLVMMRKVKMDENSSRLETELSLLKKCQSRYTVRYYDVLRKDCYWWVVCLWSVGGVDCDGVRPVWFDLDITE